MVLHSFNSTSVFSVICFRQFGQRAVSVSTKSDLPDFPVASASAQSRRPCPIWAFSLEIYLIRHCLPRSNRKHVQQLANKNIAAPEYPLPTKNHFDRSSF